MFKGSFIHRSFVHLSDAVFIELYQNRLPAVGFEPTIPESEWSQNLALDRSANYVTVSVIY